MDALNKTLSRLPIIPLAVLYIGWLVFSYYSWLNAPDSELGLKRGAITSSRSELENTKKKLAEGEEFFKNLDAIRVRIRQLTTQLDSSKAVLSADIDIANFVRMVTLESKKLGITIKSITPLAEQKQDFYTEVPFNVSLTGAYVQVLVFFDRIAKLQQVIRVSDFDLKPTGNTYTKYVELGGSVKLNAYKYLGTHADEIIHKAEMKGLERGEGR
jgi:Tfp pilus assembly protein PilO